jgi:hypothetical protein
MPNTMHCFLNFDNFLTCVFLNCFQYKGASFTPGKGMRAHEDELIAGLQNPALGNFRGNAKGKSFIPGRGMRAHDEELVAGLQNPALGNFRGNAKGKSFIPGRGMRNKSDDLC